MANPKLTYGVAQDIPASVSGVRHHSDAPDTGEQQIIAGGPQLSERLYDFTLPAGLSWGRLRKDTDGRLVLTVYADEVDLLLP